MADRRGFVPAVSVEELILRHAGILDALLSGPIDHDSAVHQLRVAIRHLRAATTVLGPLLDPVIGPGLAAELRRQAHALAPSRDLQVMRERLQPLLDRSPASATEAAALLRARLEASAPVGPVGRVPDAFDGAALHRELAAAVGVLAGRSSVDPAAARSLTEHALDDLVAALVPLTAADRGTGSRPGARRLHALRKQIKTSRTVLVLLEAPARDRTRALRSLGRLQDRLGEHHDAYLVRRFLKAWADDPSTSASGSRQLARGLRRQERARMRVLERRLPGAATGSVAAIGAIRRTPAVQPSPG